MMPQILHNHFSFISFWAWKLAIYDLLLNGFYSNRLIWSDAQCYGACLMKNHLFWWFFDSRYNIGIRSSGTLNPNLYGSQSIIRLIAEDILNMTGLNLCQIASSTFNPESSRLQHIILLRAFQRSWRLSAD